MRTRPQMMRLLAGSLLLVACGAPKGPSTPGDASQQQELLVGLLFKLLKILE